MNHYAGVDYHKSYSVATVVDESGKVVGRKRLENRQEDFRDFFKSYRNITAVVEASGTSVIAIRLLEDIVTDLKLAHPYKVRLIAESKIKTDKIDSEVLAQLLRVNLIPEAYKRSKKESNEQRILRARMFYVNKSTAIKNHIHYLISIQFDQNIRETSKSFSDLFGKKGIAWLKSLPLSETDLQLVNNALAGLEKFQEIISVTNRLIKKIFNENTDCQLLHTIPGLGNFLSVLVKTEIASLDRFISADKLCSYAGLVPSTRSSAGKTFNGRIIKQSNKWLRWAMIEAVYPAISANAELKTYYYKIKGRKCAQTARIAVARRLLRIVYRVLKEQNEFKNYIHEFKNKHYQNNYLKKLVESPSALSHDPRNRVHA